MAIPVSTVDNKPLSAAPVSKKPAMSVIMSYSSPIIIDNIYLSILYTAISLQATAITPITPVSVPIIIGTVALYLFKNLNNYIIRFPI